MADVFTAAKRSLIMAAVLPHGNRNTELRLAAIFRHARINGWRRNVALPGRPDFVFRKVRLAVFVDGCFWHSCPLHGQTPSSNRDYWLAKLARNRARDVSINRELRQRGWRVLRIWEHELRKAAKIERRCQRAMVRSTSQAKLLRKREGV